MMKVGIFILLAVLELSSTVTVSQNVTRRSVYNVTARVSNNETAQRKVNVNAALTLRTHAKANFSTTSSISPGHVTAISQKMNSGKTTQNRTTETKSPTRFKITRHHPRADVHQKMRRVHLREGSLNASDGEKSMKNGHHFFLNQFFYELNTVRCCFYQYVKKGCTIIVLYQSLGYEPITIYIADQDDEVVHENQLRKGGRFTLTSKHGGNYKICVENYSWSSKKIFLSIRVESHRNSKVMLSEEHPIAHTVMGHIRNLEVEARSIATHLWQRKAVIMTENILVEEENNLIIWMTWTVMVTAVVTYVLQVIEIHRLFRESELKKTFSMGGGQLKIGRRI